MDDFLFQAHRSISLTDKSAQAESADFFLPQDKSAQADSIDFRPPFSSISLPPMETSFLDQRVLGIAEEAEEAYKAHYRAENNLRLRQALASVKQRLEDEEAPFDNISRKHTQERNYYSPSRPPRQPQPRSPYRSSPSRQTVIQRPPIQFLYPATRDFYVDQRRAWVNVKPLKKLQPAPLKEVEKPVYDPRYVIYQDKPVQAFLDQGKKALKAQKYQLALTKLNEAKGAGYVHSDLFYLLGETKRQMLKLEEAEKDLLRALKFEVHSPFVYESLGLLYKEVGKYENAIPLLRSFIDQLETPEAHNQLGVCYTKVGEYVNAAVHLTRAIHLSPDRAEFYYNRGVAYEGQDMFTQALEDYAISKKLDQEQFRGLVASKILSLLSRKI